MAVALPAITGATIESEYAATAINFSRTMQPDASGHYQPVFAGSISYQRTDYVTDGNGNKTGIVQHVPQQGPGMQPDPYYGAVAVTAAQLGTMDATVPTTGLLTAIAAQADALIQADLVARGILAAS